MPMKEQVTDISKVLQGMTEEIRLLRGTVNQQYAEIIKLNRNINALNLEIRKKDTELINLRERLAKYENPDKNSNVTNLFREAIHEWNTNPNDVIDKVSWTRRLDNLLKQNIEELGKKFITFRKGLVKCRDYIFNFLENPMIPFDNNGSERGIRKLKIKLKNSCTFRSDFGADAFLELHSIVETAKKHDKTPYNAIQALFKV